MVLRLCLIFENKTEVGSSENVVQLIKAHSLHTLFAVFEKNRNWPILAWFCWKFRFFSKTANKVFKLCAWTSWTTLSLRPTSVYFPKLDKGLKFCQGLWNNSYNNNFRCNGRIPAMRDWNSPKILSNILLHMPNMHTKIWQFSIVISPLNRARKVLTHSWPTRKTVNLFLKFDIKIPGHCKNSQKTRNNSKNIVVISVKFLENFDSNKVYKHNLEISPDFIGPPCIYAYHPVIC